MTTNTKVSAGLAIPPGYYVAELLDDLGMTQVELARRMGRPKQAINEICRGKKEITAETADQLDRALEGRIDAQMLMNLEGAYRLALARGKPHIDALDDMEPADN